MAKGERIYYVWPETGDAFSVVNPSHKLREHFWENGIKAVGRMAFKMFKRKNKRPAEGGESDE